MNALQLSLPLVPENAILLSDKLAFLNMNGFIHFLMQQALFIAV